MAGYFWVCAADSLSGNRQVGTEELLSPGPIRVYTPEEAAGVLLQTPGGTLVKQSPTKDSRERFWEWSGLASYKPAQMRLIGRLEGLVASTRRARGLSPWVFLKDGVTFTFRRLLTFNGTLTGVSGAVITDTSQSFSATDPTDGYGVVEIIQGTAKGQRRSVIGNTSTTLTLQSGFSPAASVGDSYNLQYTYAPWIRVRVISVTKQLRQKSGIPVYESLRVSYVIDDPAWNDLG